MVSTEQKKRARQDRDDSGEPEARVDDLMEALRLKLGTRIEVLWRLEPDEDNADSDVDGCQGSTNKDTRKLWWGARFDGAAGFNHCFAEDVDADEDQQLASEVGSASMLPVHHIVYDARPHDGFEDEVRHQVCFLNEHRLVDVEADCIFFWRHQGCDWDTSCDESEQDGLKSTSDDAERENYGKRQKCESYDHCDGEFSHKADDHAVVEAMVTTVLGSVLRTHSDRFDREPMERQLVIADRIATLREKVEDRLIQHSDESAVENIDGDSMRAIIAELQEEHS